MSLQTPSATLGRKAQYHARWPARPCYCVGLKRLLIGKDVKRRGFSLAESIVVGTFLVADAIRDAS